jgi:hypothetical protein
MRKGTHHTPETRLAIRLKRLEKSMPPAEFARFKASNGALKWCPKGEHLMPVSEFYKNRRAWDGLFDRCKECAAALSLELYRDRSQDAEWRERKNRRQAARRTAHSGSERALRANKKYSLKHYYGLTLEQFEAMLAAQGNRCAICNQPFGSTAKSVHVDHDHTTNLRHSALIAGWWLVMF